MSKEGKDCLECKIVGVCTLGGISLYSAKLFISTPKSNYQQRIFLSFFGLGFLGTAVYRAIQE
jgi:hypothetical protein